MKGLKIHGAPRSLEPAVAFLAIILVIEMLCIDQMTQAYCRCIFWLSRSDMGEMRAHDLMMAGVFALSYAAWSVVRLRGHATTATGGGFVIAASGLFLRIYAETALYPHHAAEPPRIEAVDFFLIDAAAVGGFIAFVFGLAMVVAACLAERRLAREAPDWLREVF
jgi:hypothetical protein